MGTLIGLGIERAKLIEIPALIVKLNNTYYVWNITYWYYLLRNTAYIIRNI